MTTVAVELGAPVTVALAPPEVRGWGPYQFPILARLPDGHVRLSWHVEADSATAYGLPRQVAVSADDGRTWTPQPPEAAESVVLLANGDLLAALRPKSVDPATLALPPKPFAEFVNYRIPCRLYRLADLPIEGADGWRLLRCPAGSDRWQPEQPTVRLPGETRVIASDVFTFPQFHFLYPAPDGSLWGVDYQRRIVDGRAQNKHAAVFLRSTDGGRSWDFLSDIPYAPDPAADPKAAIRLGFTEPGLGFLPDGSVLALLRTTDGEGVGPLYEARSTDGGRTWSAPTVFDDLGVWPQLLRQGNGVTLAAYGRPGLYVRATADPAGREWDDRVTVVPHAGTCSYPALLPLTADSALLAYSETNLAGPDGSPRKGIRVRTVTARPVGGR